MATRQYIGARYVIKIYENSQVAGSAEWEADTSYEPLTMVTYQNSSYLSKKAVPATVGNPAVNGDYWVVTGAYNGQIAQLQADIDTLQSVVSQNRKFILLGDSFGYGITPPSYSSVNGVGWIKWFENTVGYFCDVYYPDVTVLPGVAGFASSLPFLTMLQSLNSTITNKDEITDIVVLGGTNDVSQNNVTKTAIISAINSFMAYCRTNYPNAHVKIGILSTRIQHMYVDSAKTLEAYRTCSNYGAEFISDGIGLYSKPDTICSDETHLTQAGYEYYTPYVNNLILSGHTSYEFLFRLPITLDADQVTYAGEGSYLQIELVYTPHYIKSKLMSNVFTSPYLVILERNWPSANHLTLAAALSVDNNFEMPEQYNILCGGVVIEKDNNTGACEMISTWRAYNDASKTIALQLAKPLGNPHRNDDNYTTVLVVDCTHEQIIPIG